MHILHITRFFHTLLRKPVRHALPQVRELVEECQCASQFSMVRVSEGKYRIGDTKILIFVRVSGHTVVLKLKLYGAYN